MELGQSVKCIDINKCRRNITMYSGYNFPVYSVLDNWENFDGKIEDGNYYIETFQYFPFRGNGVYCRAVVEYGLKQNLITMNDIKGQFKSASVLKDDYFQGFINHLLETFDFNKDVQKLAPNGWVGCMGSRHSSLIQSKYCKFDNKDQVGLIYEKFKHPFINKINDNECIFTDKVDIKHLDTNFYIYSQIVDIEAMEAHKLFKMIQSNGGVPICVKTDAIIYVEKNEIDISNFYFDKEKTILKYKFEEKIKLLEKSVIIQETRKLSFHTKKYDVYDENDIYADDSYDSIAEKIIQTEKGVLCLGPAGTGKSYLIKKIVQKLDALKRSYVRLTPTNKSALEINGTTLDKFCHGYQKSKNKIDYIFVDEVSMMKEHFYQMLISLKNDNPTVKFIICGDFYQAKPVDDRIQNRSYQNSQVLKELVDYKKLYLTRCKRSDDELFNINEKVKVGIPIDISIFKNKDIINNINICFTNKCRILINTQRAVRFLRLNPNEERQEIKKLGFDDNSQDYILCKGMPLIARKNLKSQKIVNTEIYKCDGFDGENVKLSSKVKDSTERKILIIPIKKINQYFHLAFAITAHKSQSATLIKPYTIHEWQKMDDSLKYVALSRATDIKNITIC